MRKLIITGMAVAMLAVPAAASADTPDGTYTVAPKANENASEVGKQSSQIKQNGQFVSGKWTGLDGWQDQKGDRAAIVQETLGH
jgi:polyisoprenoid-binding protein YceI